VPSSSFTSLSLATTTSVKSTPSSVSMTVTPTTCGGARRVRDVGTDAHAELAFHQGTTVHDAFAYACEHAPAPSWPNVVSPVATGAHVGLLSCSAQPLPAVLCASQPSHLPGHALCC
jgi:hypothetical protein